MILFYHFLILLVVILQIISEIVIQSIRPDLDITISYWIIAVAISTFCTVMANIISQSSTLGILILSFGKVPLGLVKSLIGSAYIHLAFRYAILPLTIVGLIGSVLFAESICWTQMFTICSTILMALFVIF